MKKVLLMIIAVVLVVLAGTSNTNPVSAESEFSHETNARQAKVLSRAEGIVASDSYPSYFGGIFISEDSTHVVIQIVESHIPQSVDSEGYSSFLELNALDGNIVFEYVKYSYQELNEINDRITAYYQSADATQGNFRANFVDVFNNVVVIELLETVPDKIESYREDVLFGIILKADEHPADIIRFTEGHNHDLAIKVGEEIEVTDGYCSMGFRAKMDGDKGYFTAGHCFDDIGDDSTGGTVEYRAYSGSVDAAWVKTTFWTNLFDPPSNELEFPGGSVTELNNEACPILCLNLAIAKSGHTTEYTSGQIKNLDYSGYYGDTYFTGLVATDFEVGAGDSGGGVFTPNNGYPAGIVKGTSYYGAAFVTIFEIYDLWEYESW